MLKIINYNADEYDFPALVVLGCFDAVHIGHQALLKKAKLNAKINGLDLGVMMFADGKGGRQVFTFEERVAMLEQYNAKFILRIDYTEEFKKTSAQDFLENLEQHINLKGYMSGKDFRFGAGAKGKSSTLKKYAEDEDNAVWYEAVKDVALDGEKVSTTLIKQCLEEGKINKASQLLGRQYFVSGEVYAGHGRGKQLGFPTANIAYPENKVLVAPGVYGVEAEIDGTVYKGVANCGPRPTFGEDSYTLEVYFEGLSEDLYGKTVTVRFLNYIRGIRKFATAEELAAQIAVDATCIGAPDAAVEEAPAVAAEAPVTEEPAVEEVAEEPVTEEVAEEPAAEEVAEEPATEEVAEETVTEEAAAEEQPAEEEIAVAAEEVAETLSEETPEETFAEVVEDETETPHRSSPSPPKRNSQPKKQQRTRSGRSCGRNRNRGSSGRRAARRRGDSSCGRRSGRNPFGGDPRRDLCRGRRGRNRDPRAGARHRRRRGARSRGSNRRPRSRGSRRGAPQPKSLWKNPQPKKCGRARSGRSCGGTCNRGSGGRGIRGRRRGRG